MTARDVRTFPDLPIAGMVGNKEAVYITLDYEFEDYTIHVEHVFAWRDSETGNEYIPGDLAIVVDEEVRRFAAVIEQYRADVEARNTNVREFSFRLPHPPAVQVSA